MVSLIAPLMTGGRRLVAQARDGVLVDEEHLAGRGQAADVLEVVGSYWTLACCREAGSISVRPPTVTFSPSGFAFLAQLLWATRPAGTWLIDHDEGRMPGQVLPPGSARARGRKDRSRCRQRCRGCMVIVLPAKDTSSRRRRRLAPAQAARPAVQMAPEMRAAFIVSLPVIVMRGAAINKFVRHIPWLD